MKTSDGSAAPAGGGASPGGGSRRTGKGPGYMDQEVMGCQFSIYPLRQDDVGPAVRDAIAAARAEGCAVRVGNLSTLITADEDRVFRGLRAAYRAAQRHGSVVMTATFAAGMPTDALVGQIQDEIAPDAGEPGAGSPARG